MNYRLELSRKEIDFDIEEEVRLIKYSQILAVAYINVFLDVGGRSRAVMSSV